MNWKLSSSIASGAVYRYGGMSRKGHITNSRVHHIVPTQVTQVSIQMGIPPFGPVFWGQAKEKAAQQRRERKQAAKARRAKVAAGARWHSL